MIEKLLLQLKRSLHPSLRCIGGCQIVIYTDCTLYYTNNTLVPPCPLLSVLDNQGEINKSQMFLTPNIFILLGLGTDNGACQEQQPSKSSGGGPLLLRQGYSRHGETLICPAKVLEIGQNVPNSLHKCCFHPSSDISCTKFLQLKQSPICVCGTQWYVVR